MLIKLGKHRRKTTEQVVLGHPDYVVWMLSLDRPFGQLPAVRLDVQRLIQLFDRKPVRRPCRNPKCCNRATRGGVCAGGANLVWCCDGCAPGGVDAAFAKLPVVRSYQDAINYAKYYWPRRMEDLGPLITAMAEAKGLPTPWGEEEAEAFFARE